MNSGESKSGCEYIRKTLLEKFNYTVYLKLLDGKKIEGTIKGYSDVDETVTVEGNNGQPRVVHFGDIDSIKLNPEELYGKKKL